MPGPRGLDRSLIEDALAALTGALSEVGAPWMVIGGIALTAVIADGVRRMTSSEQRSFSASGQRGTSAINASPKVPRG